MATAVAGLGPGDDEASSVAVRLRDALYRAGLSDLSAALGARMGGADPLGGLTDALASTREPTLLVIDDAQYAEHAGKSLLRFVRELPEPHQLVVLARRLPSGLERLRREPGVVLLTADDIAFAAEDVAGLYEAGFGVALAEPEARALVRATGGWAAALVLAAPRIAETSERAALVASLAKQDNVLDFLVQDAMAALPPGQREAVVALAHLPLITDEAVIAIGRGTGMVSAAADAGLPLARTEDGRWWLPGPVQDSLVRSGPLPVAMAERAAEAYVGAGLHEQALEVLLRAGQTDSAAALLASLRPAAVERVDFEHVRDVVAALPAVALRTHPRVHLQLARACEPAAAGQIRTRALEQARALAANSNDGTLLHEVEAETAKDLVRDGRLDEAARLAARVLDELGPHEAATRARLLHTLGRVKSFRFDPLMLAEAEPLLREAARLYDLAGETNWRAQALLVLGSHVLFPQGLHKEAEAVLSEALDILPRASRFRAVVLTFKADVLVDRGEYAELQATTEEARRIGEMLGDQRVLAYVAWNAARASSQSGDAEATLEHVHEVERHRADWFEHATGAEFLADAALLLDRVGETGEASRYLARAKSRAAESKAVVLLAEAAVEARSGDPSRAATLFAAGAELESVETREAWRITLLRAYAALRQGEDAADLAATAFEQAAAWTGAPIPLLRERAIATQLLALAADAGSPAARRLHVDELPITVSLLGGFEVRQGGRLLMPPPGKPTTLAKLVATRGSVHSEEASEALWPEVDPESGRRRLRNVLNRLRSSADIVIRNEHALELVKGIEVDARRFGDEADQALSLARSRRAEAAVVARRAVARYRGELLPDDPYEPWASVAREWLRGRYIELLDLLVDDAEASGDLDEALRLQRRHLEVDPLDEEQYLRGARLLAAQGRRLAAAEMLQRGTQLLSRFDLPAPPEFDELAGALVED